MPLVKLTPRLMSLLPVGFVVIPEKLRSMEPLNPDDCPVTKLALDSKS